MENWVGNGRWDYYNLTIFLQYLVLSLWFCIQLHQFLILGRFFSWVACVCTLHAEGAMVVAILQRTYWCVLVKEILVRAGETENEMFVSRYEVSMCLWLNSAELKCRYTVERQWFHDGFCMQRIVWKTGTQHEPSHSGALVLISYLFLLVSLSTGGFFQLKMMRLI